MAEDVILATLTLDAERKVGGVEKDDRTDAVGDSRPVTLFARDCCPDSAPVRARFRRSGLPIVERNVTGNLDAAPALLATGMFATPTVRFGPRLVVGAWLAHLAALGFRCRCSGVSA